MTRRVEATGFFGGTKYRSETVALAAAWPVGTLNHSYIVRGYKGEPDITSSRSSAIGVLPDGSYVLWESDEQVKDIHEIPTVVEALATIADQHEIDTSDIPRRGPRRDTSAGPTPARAARLAELVAAGQITEAEASRIAPPGAAISDADWERIREL